MADLFLDQAAELGRCGAHFCGLNTRHFGWQLEGRYAEEWIDDHWQLHLPTLCQRVGIDMVRTASPCDRPALGKGSTP